MPTSSVLDIGTRFGSFLSRLHCLGYRNLTGIDINADSIASGKKSYPALAENLQHYAGDFLPFEAAQFDVVTAFDVIEHAADAAKFLREIYRVLRPGGTFVFQTPNVVINVPKEVIYNRSLTAWRTYHCSLQSLGSLRRVLQDAMFCEVTIEKHDICTEYNLALIKTHLGVIGPWILHFLQVLPLPLYPNFWGHAHKIRDSQGGLTTSCR